MTAGAPKPSSFEDNMREITRISQEAGYYGQLRALDLFCKAGGAAMGYYVAGFDVFGVDIEPQPHYPFAFTLADALDFPLDGFDFVHASPPCQKFTRFQQSQPQRTNRHPDLIGPIRERLKAWGGPYIIENVPGAPLIAPVQLCGTSFGLSVERGQLWRHRWFESNLPLVTGPCQHDGRPAVMVAGHGRDGYRGSGLTAAEARQAMRIDWMNRDELAEAVPPSYTEFLGRQVVEYFRARAVA